MADDDDLLEKADALMRRHRVFVAGAAAARDDGGDDDVPLLTEIVAADALPEAAVATTVDIAAWRSALALEMEHWLDEDLPQHVQRVLDGITDQLIIQLSLKARAELLPRLQAILAAAPAPAAPEPADD
ncbi:MAG: hypothetical protein PHY45_17310 [Rhodocyclaceae bacterium]|nr:hypothetical protein [Rhodocyclaceae bacterium]